MPTFHELFLRRPEAGFGPLLADARPLTELGLRWLEGAEPHPDDEWLRVSCLGAGPPWDAMARISIALRCEVVGLMAQTSSDVLVFRRYREGEELRALEHGDADGWAPPRGEPEPWEAEILFADLAPLRDAVDAMDDATERAQLERCIATRRIEGGCTLPRPSSSTFADIAAALGVDLSGQPELECVRRRDPEQVLGFGACALGAALSYVDGSSFGRPTILLLVGFAMIWAGVVALLRKRSVPLGLLLGLIGAAVGALLLYALGGGFR